MNETRSGIIENSTLHYYNSYLYKQKELARLLSFIPQAPDPAKSTPHILNQGYNAPIFFHAPNVKPSLVCAERQNQA